MKKNNLDTLIKQINKNFNQEKLDKVYDILYKKLEELKLNLPKWWYPKNSISAKVWMLWAEIYDFCYDIFEIVKNHTDLDTEQKFLWIWSSATFWVVSHYRSNVWAIMTETIYFFERKWEFEKIPSLAQAVFNDFELLIDYIDSKTEIENIDFDTIHGINYLIIVCKKMIEYGNNEEKNHAKEILKKIEQIPEKFHKLLDYDFNYKKWYKLLS